MSRPNWLIEPGDYGSVVESHAVEVRRQGMECRFVAYREIVKVALQAWDRLQS
jgi:hypothetical protein